MKTNPSWHPALPRAAKCFLALAGVLPLLLAPSGCASASKSAGGFLPDEKEFLSAVRYIITKKERKLFRATPPRERSQFIDEFWKVRDPDPSTEENEYRDEYFRRIAEANRLFREGSAGWLSDRGRILILLGEPDRRDTYPSGYSFYEPPVEIWFYGMFPVIFVDSQREGVYRLDPVSARRLSAINVAQMQLKPKGIDRGARLFSFALSARALAPGQARLLISVPYRVTSLVLNPDSGAYETKLKLTVRVSGADGAAVLEREITKPVSVSDDMLAGLGKDLELEFDVELPAGDYTALVTLENAADNSQASREIKLKL